MLKLVYWLERLRASIFLKLLSGFVVISLFLIALTAFSIFTFNRLGDNIGQVRDSQEKVNRSTILVDSVTDLQNALSRLKLDVDSINRQNQQLVNTSGNNTATASSPFIANYRFQRTYIDDLLKTIDTAAGGAVKAGMGSTAINSFSRMMSGDFRQLLQDLDEVVNSTAANNPADALARWQKIESQVGMTTTEIANFIRALNQNLTEVDANGKKTVQDAENYRSVAIWIIVLICVGVVVIAMSFGGMMAYVFTRPVQKLKSRLEKLAEGDLATRLEVNNGDEFGELVTTFNQSIERLGDLVEQVQNQSVRISSAAAQIAAASRMSANISTEQAGAVAEATVTIEELSHTALQIAEAASLVAQAAEMALVSVNDGQDMVKESIAGINMLKLQVQEIAVKILALSERSQRVGHIIEQINSIADQTHLLALNAAIESAAAGESGKRFAVVAAEVKKLAERSRTATREVQSVLTEIQNATTASVMATEQGMKQTEQGVILAHRSGDANESIMQMVERTVQLASAISLATQQQRSASEQVVLSMRQLATVIQDGASTARQSSSLAASLDEVAAELRVLTGQFKVFELPEDDNYDEAGSFHGALDDRAMSELLNELTGNQPINGDETSFPVDAEPAAKE